MKMAMWTPAILILTLALTACGGPPTEPQTGQTQPVSNSVDGLGIPAEFMEEIRAAGRNLQLLVGRDDEGAGVPAHGVTIDVAQKRAASTVRKLQVLAPDGWIVFESERRYGIGGRPNQVAVLKADDMFQVVEVMGTNGWNYDISTQMLIERLRTWDQRYGLTLRGAGFDWFEAAFKRKPTNMLKFAKEVYEFCPDVVDQGTGTVEALEKEMKRSNNVYLWWD